MQIDILDEKLMYKFGMYLLRFSIKFVWIFKWIFMYSQIYFAVVEVETGQLRVKDATASVRKFIC